MQFKTIDLTGGGNIHYSLQRLARAEHPFLSILWLIISGNYRDGAAGSADACYIGGIIGIALAVWRPSGMILDLSQLAYGSGYGMEEVLKQPSKEPFAVVVGSQCEPAISKVLYGKRSTKTVLDREEYFDSFDPASHYLRRKVVEAWNMHVSRNLIGLDNKRFIDITALD